MWVYSGYGQSEHRLFDAWYRILCDLNDTHLHYYSTPTINLSSGASPCMSAERATNTVNSSRSTVRHAAWSKAQAQPRQRFHAPRSALPPMSTLANLDMQARGSQRKTSPSVFCDVPCAYAEHVEWAFGQVRYGRFEEVDTRRSPGV
jgi:hypothetical protein